MSALIPWWLLPTVITGIGVVYLFWVVFRVRGSHAYWDVFLAALFVLALTNTAWIVGGALQ